MIRVLMVDDEPLVRRGIVAGVDWAALGCEVVGEALDQFFVEVLHDDDVRELSGTGHAAAVHDLLARAAEIDRVRPRVRMRFDAARGEGGKERFHGAMVPKIRSPASPSPGTIYLFSSSRSSRLPV